MTVETKIKPHHRIEHSSELSTGIQDILFLEQGDHLTRREFEQRYEATPRLKKAELIQGRVYMPSPVKNTHSEAHCNLIMWLATYRTATPGIHLNDNATVRLDNENEVQPDVLLRLEAKLGGTSTVSDDDYIEGVPELIVEIAASSASYDLYEKFEIYEQHGVQEYIVWQVYENRLNWFQLKQTEYVAIAPDTDGIIRSRTFPGLSLGVSELLAGNMLQVVEILHEGMQTEAYTAFVERLKKAS